MQCKPGTETQCKPGVDEVFAQAAATSLLQSKFEMKLRHSGAKGVEVVGDERVDATPARMTTTKKKCHRTCSFCNAKRCTSCKGVNVEVSRANPQTCVSTRRRRTRKKNKKKDKTPRFKTNRFVFAKGTPAKPRTGWYYGSDCSPPSLPIRGLTECKAAAKDLGRSFGIGNWAQPVSGCYVGGNGKVYMNFRKKGANKWGTVICDSKPDHDGIFKKLDKEVKEIKEVGKQVEWEVEAVGKGAKGTLQETMKNIGTEVKSVKEDLDELRKKAKKAAPVTTTTTTTTCHKTCQYCDAKRCTWCNGVNVQVSAANPQKCVSTRRRRTHRRRGT